MTHFTDRDSLIRWLYNSVEGYRAVYRAMDDGTIENLGHFSDLMPFHRPGFIVRVYSTHNKEYLLAVTNKSMINTGVYVIDEVPWDTWNGDSHESKLFQGDNLETYKKFREGVTGV